jgi:hypothetical protein
LPKANLFEKRPIQPHDNANLFDGYLKLGGALPMNTLPPRFNAPIPEYANLNFLFHRWGYNQLGENGLKLFYDAVQGYVEEGLLKFYIFNSGYDLVVDDSHKDWNNLPYEFFEETYKSISESESIPDSNFTLEWKTGNDLEDMKAFEAAYMLARLKMGRETDEQKNRNYGLTAEELKKHGFRFVDHKNSPNFYQLKDFEINDDETINIQLIQYSDSEAVIVEKGFKPVKTDSPLGVDIEAIYHKHLPDIGLMEIICQRNNLRGFEQKTGFLNHGISDKLLKKYAPTPTTEEKNKGGKHLKGFIKKLSNEQLERTALAYAQAKKLYPQSNTKGVRLQTAAEIITKLEGQKIGDRGVQKRLEKRGFTDW